MGFVGSAHTAPNARVMAGDEPNERWASLFRTLAASRGPAWLPGTTYPTPGSGAPRLIRASWLAHNQRSRRMAPCVKPRQNYMDPEIRLEQTRLDTLRSQNLALGVEARGARKFDKEIKRQEAQLAELQDFAGKLERAAKLNFGKRILLTAENAEGRGRGREESESWSCSTSNNAVGLCVNFRYAHRHRQTLQQ